ncbi:helix-turn-helix domain-containing protein [Acidisoma cellulosilytica]|uniref:Helix-turn-helix domain-containing protein n=1 Tax=Acidisoma cellulosilyticum TaxID=2802395 RepID=A0A963YYU6_9PROT|nr:XRE family transcriptional regulator [Acidisoma cellulosilyticum]MCB8879535.1 helix-turn-helix domain-containing protein [Acidisoma cellulosilyticum]
MTGQTTEAETEARIAQRVRLERDARGWSLADLAERSGLAKATISKIERQEMSPTAVSLLKLATAFDLTLAGLLLRAEQATGRVSRAADQPLWRDPETGYLRQQIFSRSDFPLELVQVTMPPGQRVTLPASSFVRLRQLLMVQTGTLVLTEGASDRHDLKAGDCLAFGPPADATFANEATEPCTYTVFLMRS